MEFILQQQAKTEALLAQTAERGARTDARLDRAVRLAVQEARNERKKRREMDSRWQEEMAKLSAAQRATDEAVARVSNRIDAFIASMRNGGNAHPAN